MLSTLSPAPFDPILGVGVQFRADPRPDKIDLGVGVYRDETGAAPIFRAVKTAERRLLESQTTKAYLAIQGDDAFCAALAPMVFGDAAPADRLRGVQTPGGCGALSVLAGLARRAGARRMWSSDPTWANHIPIGEKAGLETRRYPYIDGASRLTDFDRMRAALKDAGPHDVVILHGCCHNPTGADLTTDHWNALADMAETQGFLPLIDLAYQGFGQGLDADAAGLRLMVRRLPNLLVAVSCSKTFGLYRDRVGAAFVLAQSPTAADNAFGQACEEVRATYSFPPDHGAALVRDVLTDPTLAADWRAELDAARLRVTRLRAALAAALQRETNTDRYAYLTAHQGMFSLMDLGSERVAQLRDDHGLYIVGTGRVNIAGLTEASVDRVAALIAAAKLE